MSENKLEMNEVFRAVATERAYQEDLWTNPSMSPGDCLHYMQHHLNKAVTAYSTTECVGVCDSVLDQIRKITALGIACGEEHGMPLRAGFEKEYLFVTGDFITLDDDDEDYINIYQCICSDNYQAVFGKCRNGGDCIITSYEDLFVVTNKEGYGFKFIRMTIDDLRRAIQETA